ncbi:MAG: beta-N-acetylhexosaminidase [Verrucomicrobiota bacterium]
MSPTSSSSPLKSSPLELPINIIPLPVGIQRAERIPFHWNATTKIHSLGNETLPIEKYLSESLAQRTGITAGKASSGSNTIVLQVTPSFIIDGPDWAIAEAYQLICTPQQITIVARTPHGLFNGVQTLIQLVTSSNDQWVVPSLTIDDHPRFQWRGLMLDCCRHFSTVPEVCRLIDLMAFYKLNTFHWHLTEDQGWRIEVKAYPRLTEVGAWRSESPVMGEAKVGDGQPYGGFYTQDDLRTVVAYAATRHVTVIPEIEMPGHCTACIASYPELGNDDIPEWRVPETGTKWGVIARTLSPKEETFDFIAKVFDEILPIFPSPYVHIGGDEAPKEEWKNSPFAQKVMKENGLQDEHELQSYFIRRVEKLLHERGKKLIGWDEIQEGGLSPSATMMVWRDWKWAKQALELGNNIIVTHNEHTYFDYGQGEKPEGPEYEMIGNERTLDKVYHFDPIPEGTPPGRIHQVLGCQGQLWCEFIWSPDKLDYMIWPRACALAEVAWSPLKSKDFTGFQQRLVPHLDRFDALKVNYRKADGSPAKPYASMTRRFMRPPLT